MRPSQNCIFFGFLLTVYFIHEINFTKKIYFVNIFREFNFTKISVYIINNLTNGSERRIGIFSLVTAFFLISYGSSWIIFVSFWRIVSILNISCEEFFGLQNGFKALLNNVRRVVKRFNLHFLENRKVKKII